MSGNLNSKNKIEKDFGAMVVSLDFELLWGVFDKVNYKKKYEYFENTLETIPVVLQLFKDFDIHGTWATVGMLFNQNWNDWNRNLPKNLPEYENRDLSAYRFGKIIQNKLTEKMCFAPGLIAKIRDTPHQEVATHTYSHYYCLEPGQELSSFRADLEKSIYLAEIFNIELKSLIFPRNQFNQDYLKICKELGIENVRSNPTDWYWKDIQKDSLVNKIFRTGEAYIGPRTKSYNQSEITFDGDFPVSQKASRFLRPYSSNQFLNRRKINRIKSEIYKAAKNKEVYHLWWHPHNFGSHPEESLRDLREILEVYKECRNNFNFQSLSMAEVGDFVKKLSL